MNPQEGWLVRWVLVVVHLKGTSVGVVFLSPRFMNRHTMGDVRSALRKTLSKSQPTIQQIHRQSKCSFPDQWLWTTIPEYLPMVGCLVTLGSKSCHSTVSHLSRMIPPRFCILNVKWRMDGVWCPEPWWRSTQLRCGGRSEICCHKEVQLCYRVITRTIWLYWSVIEHMPWAERVVWHGLAVSFKTCELV